MHKFAADDHSTLHLNFVKCRRIEPSSEAACGTAQRGLTCVHSGVQSKMLAADQSTQLPTMHGAAARYIEDAANGVSAGALTAPPAGQLSDVTLFIDAFSQNLGASATTKGVTIIIGGHGGGWGGGWGSGGWGGGGWGGGWGGWHGGWGWGK